MASGFDIATADRIDAFDDDFARLEAEGCVTAFQTRAWLRPFYEILAPRLGARPLILRVRDAADGAPLLMLPLATRRKYGVAVAEFADLGVSDYNAPLFSRRFNPSIAQWRAIYADIVAALDGVAMLRLQKMPMRVHAGVNPLIGEGATSMAVGCWGVALPSTLAAYSREALTPTFQKEMAKKIRRVAKRGAVEFAAAQTREEKRAVFELLARQRQARCDEMGRRNILAEPDYRAFYEAVAIHSDAPLARLFSMKVNGVPVAAMFALERGEAIHVIMTTFEGGEWKSCSLGNVLIHAAIEDAIARGLRYFDLTLGDESYKRDFGATRLPLFSAMTPRSSVGALMTAALVHSERWKRAAQNSAFTAALRRAGFAPVRPPACGAAPADQNS
jgi:CelD/BcsL family acetyltransferase involved in cellulose biosynthesis